MPLIRPALVPAILWLSAAAAFSADDDKKPAADEKKPAANLKFTVSQQTTYFTKPLTDEGFVDYAGVINERMGKGVTPENNAVALLVRALGPAPEGRMLDKAYFEQLGVEAPPEEGEYFVPLETYLVKRGIKTDDPRYQEILQEQGKASAFPWTARQYPEIAAWLASNEKPLGIVEEAARRPRSFTPLIVPDDETSGGLIAALLPWVQQYRGVTRAFTARAMLRVGERKTDAAWNDLLTCHRLARLAGQGPTLIDALVSFSIDGLATAGDLSWISAVRPDSKRALQCLRDLDALGALPRTADKVDLAERCMFLDAVFLIARNRVPEDEELAGIQKLTRKFALGLVNWDLTLKMGNEWTDRQVKIMRLPTRAERTKEFEALEREIKAFAAESRNVGGIVATLLTRGNPADEMGKTMGKVLLTLLLPATSTARNAEDRVEQRLRNLRLAFALQAYRSDEGKFPESLAALAPKYLSEVPNDLYSEKPLIYKPGRDGFLLYSVGDNGTDDEGTSYSDKPSGDDQVVRIPVPMP